MLGLSPATGHLEVLGCASSRPNEGWQIETASPFAGMTFEAGLLGLAMTDPIASGYADDMGQGAVEACQADLDDLFASLDPASVWVTRIRAELAYAALASDLDLQAASAQSQVPNVLFVPDASTIGNPCAYADCYSGSSGNVGAGAGASYGDGGGASDEIASSGGGCACAVDGSTSFPGGLATLGALGMAAALRRRMTNRRARR